MPKPLYIFTHLAFPTVVHFHPVLLARGLHIFTHFLKNRVSSPLLLLPPRLYIFTHSSRAGLYILTHFIRQRCPITHAIPCKKSATTPIVHFHPPSSRCCTFSPSSADFGGCLFSPRCTFSRCRVGLFHPFLLGKTAQFGCTFSPILLL